MDSPYRVRGDISRPRGRRSRGSAWMSGFYPYPRRVECAAMKCVIQRVRRASVTVGNELVSEIGSGLLVLAAVEKGDGEAAMAEAAKKIRELRIFSDDAGKMNRDVAETGGAI